jgi:hypothetical protein
MISTRAARFDRLGRGVAVAAAIGALALAPVVSIPAVAAPVPAELITHPLGGVNAAALAELSRQPPEKAPQGGANADAAPTASRPTVLTARTVSERFDAVGITWDGASDPAEGTVVSVRVREKGSWTDWYTLDADNDDGPDPGTADAAGERKGTSPLLTSGADGYQVRVDAPAGSLPPGLRVDLVDAGSPAPASAPVATADALAARPGIVSRASWGADESLRTGSPTYMPDVTVGVIHHTESTNSYTDGAAQVRSVYAFHTLSRGWSDIGYNYLVDRFGVIYEGRYGGVDRNVMGAHAGGFNYSTFGVSAIGSYTQTTPTPALVSSIQRLMAWRMTIAYIDPVGSSPLTSAGGGTARYPAGETHTFDNISGHRNTGLTDCPGELLYAQLPSIRAAVTSMVGVGLVKPSAVPDWTWMQFRGTVQTPGQTVAVSIRDTAGNTIWSQVHQNVSEPFWYALPMYNTNGAQLPYGGYEARIDTCTGADCGLYYSRPFTILPRSRVAAAYGPDGTLAVAYTDWFGATLVRIRPPSGTWSGPIALGGVTYDAPAIAFRGSAIEVAVRGTNGLVYTSVAGPGGFGGWLRTAAAVSGPPALVDAPGDGIEILGRDGAGGFARWSESTPGQVAALTGPGGLLAPGTGGGGVYTADGRLHVAVIGTNGAGYVRSLTAGQWGPWSNIGGVLVGRVVLGSLNGTSTYAVSQGTNALAYVQPLPGSGWVRARPEALATFPTAALRANGTGVLVGVDGAGQVVVSSLSGGQWQAWSRP